MVALVVASIVLAALLSLAANAATAKQHWPGPLDSLRQQSWPSVAVLVVLSLAVTGAMTWKQGRPSAGRDDPPPPQPAEVPGWFVARSETLDAVAAVCRGGRAVGITTSLWGAGGFGKTALATAVCAHKRVRRRFRSRIYTVTIGRDVRGRAAVAAKIAEVTLFITGDTTEFDDPNLAGDHLGRLLDQRPRILLVLDDVWEDEQLTPFLRGGRRCVRLVTTRNPNLLPPGARPIKVDEMSPDQARAVLAWQLPPLPADIIDALLETTGRWALLLHLTNRLIAEQTATGAAPVAAATQILQQLRVLGPAAVDEPAGAWDLDDPQRRSQAVQASIEAAITLLPPDGAARFAELAVFAEDETIPLVLVALLWRETGGLTEGQSRALCRAMERLSLLMLKPDEGGRIRLHDVIRDYLRGRLGEAPLTALHARLVSAVAATLPAAAPLAPTAPDPGRAWWRLQEGYLLDHLIEHLLAANLTAQAEAVAGDLRWVECRLTQRGPTAPWSDLALIDTPRARAAALSLAQAAHLLMPTDPARALAGVLYSRLQPNQYWGDQVTARERDASQHPLLTNRWIPPDHPASVVQRAFSGYGRAFWLLTVLPDGARIATGSYNGSVRIWDAASRARTATLTGHSQQLRSVAVTPDGARLATVGDDRTARIWDLTSGTCIATLAGHTRAVHSVAITADGARLATASHDGSVRMWDVVSRTCTAVITDYTDPVQLMAIAPDGAWLATSSRDRSLRIWDSASGSRLAGLIGHTKRLTAAVVAPDGSWLATASEDCSVQLWDLASRNCRATLTGHTERVTAMAVTPDGAWLATVSRDRTVRIWDAVRHHTVALVRVEGPLTACSWGPDSQSLAVVGRYGVYLFGLLV
ncbi:NB-ARC domain-containing protein [Streptomyces sp. T12]|uniref:NB-ARC domain-containing protein n=2 Tax=unclassified Streptomyces TaxID=2593676 RepID=UPI0027D33AEB|nr:NB-ARC domain-containing protein [Streptomyces sp. T12]